MRNKILGLIFAILVTLSIFTLAACSQPDQCLQAKDPTECRLYTQAGGNFNDYLMYGMLGYMIGNSGGQRVVMVDPNYHGRHYPRKPLMTPAQQVTKIKQKTVTTTRNGVTRSYTRTTYKSSYRSSSFGGRRR
jgi:hypothetical protein